MPPATRYLRVVPDLPDLAVEHILNRVIGRTRLRNVDPTRFLRSTKERMRVEVADFHAIDDQRVVVKAGNERWSCDHPVSVRLFLHFHFRPAPEIQSDFRGVGSLHANLNSPGAVNSRILRSPDIRRSGLKAAWLLC